MGVLETVWFYRETVQGQLLNPLMVRQGAVFWGLVRVAIRQTSKLRQRKLIISVRIDDVCGQST